MQITLNGTLLRIQWQSFRAEVDAEIIRRLESIPTAIKGNKPNTWYCHLSELETVMQAFPKAEYHPSVIAQWKPQPVPVTQAPLLPRWDAEGIAQRERRMDGVKKRKRYRRKKEGA